MNSVTVGTAGTYADWAAFKTAIELASPLGDDWDVLQISSLASGDAAAITVNLNSYSLTIRSGSAPAGDPTAGYISTFTGAGAMGCVLTGAGAFEVKDLNIRTDTGIAFSLDVAGPSGTIHDMIGIASGEASAVFLLDMGAPASSVKTYNCVGQCPASGATIVFEFAFGSSYNATTYENCTSIGATSGFDLGAAALPVKNCVAVNAAGACFANIGSAIGDGNAASDATATTGWFGGSGTSFDNIVPATEFVSLNSALTTYAKVAVGGVCEDGGATPVIVGNTLGNRGNARPHDGTDVSIGADEFASMVLPGAGSGSGGGISGAITAAMNAGYR